MSLIDTDALKDCVEKSIAEFGGLYSDDLKTGLRMCVYIAEQQPEIVRCKDCKHNQLPETSANASCEIFYGMTEPNGFCHKSERREGIE